MTRKKKKHVLNMSLLHKCFFLLCSRFDMKDVNDAEKVFDLLCNGLHKAKLVFNRLFFTGHADIRRKALEFFSSYAVKLSCTEEFKTRIAPQQDYLEGVVTFQIYVKEPSNQHLLSKAKEIILNYLNTPLKQRRNEQDEKFLQTLL